VVHRLDGTKKSGTCWRKRAMGALVACLLVQDRRKPRVAIGKPTMTDGCEYIELHAASAFSFLAGASQPDALVERAAQLDMPAIALADRNGLYGVARFQHDGGRKHGIKAHIGAEIAVRSVGNKLTPPSWLPHQCPNGATTYTLALRIANRLSEPLPAHHTFQDARDKKTEGAATLEDLEEFLRRIDLPHRRPTEGPDCSGADARRA